MPRSAPPASGKPGRPGKPEDPGRPGRPGRRIAPRLAPASPKGTTTSSTSGTSARFPIGAWLNYDFDWRGHRVFYHGWGRGGGWIERSRPYVRVNSFYVNDRYRNIVVDRRVVQRRLNFQALGRYDDVHRGAGFDNFRRTGRGVGGPPPLPNRGGVQNKIMARNFNANDPRIDEYRGRVPKGPAAVHAPESPAFTPTRGGFDPRAASQRGQASRAHAQPSRPEKPSRPAERRPR